MVDRVHVIDSNFRRRAKVAHDLSCLQRHVEIYEDLFEFLDVAPADGMILAADDSEGGGPSLQEFRAVGIVLPVIAYAENPRIEHVAEVMLAGLAGYLNWPFDNDRLLDTLDRLLEANTGRLQRESAMAGARNQVATLSPREREVLTALVAGLSNKEIARVLSISPRTVEIHRGHMMTRLGAKSVAQAVKIGLYAHLDEVTLPLTRAA